MKNKRLSVPTAPSQGRVVEPDPFRNSRNHHYDDDGNLVKVTFGLPPGVTAEQMLKVRARAKALHRKLRHKPPLEELLTPEELANGAPFYFQLTAFLHAAKKARLAAGLTLRRVAKATGLTVETLSRLETGKVTNPTWKTIGTYAVAVGGKLSLTFKPKT